MKGLLGDVMGAVILSRYRIGPFQVPLKSPSISTATISRKY